ncbi:MerR family transcriptional regulator [Propioniciclava coleopterorum]|uniref:MerR family transcriptional regulator n=1 Tax=Propioniciclava coleopterorum TaxID=2714937 RepID=A0A6G7Y8Y7_9ACTN|nr:MerR family transcriptional regulator [Propioniciclava coleopterorum]QIK73240.1 MerR family transcriptional regulator [Propioniciclava coleopterorum]
MLTIGRLADYVGVTPRAIRLYHQRGLLPEPERTASGYRVYTAQDVIDLQRIKVLTDAGVPLARVRDLLHASQADVAAAVAEVDADLRRRIADLRRTRGALATLAQGEPFLPASVAALHAGLRAIGVSEATLLRERDNWVLIHVLYPELVDQWLGTQVAMLEDPEFRDLYLLTDEAFGWEPDDPRLEEIARRTVAWMVTQTPPDTEGWDTDPVAYQLVTTYRSDVSPAWDALMTRTRELALEAGYVEPGSGPG